MKLILKKIALKDNPVQLMRQAGYSFVKGIMGEEMSFERALAANGWPRWHAYVKEDAETVSINLHLDQKRPSYAGGAAHSGEYDGELLVEEIDRIKRLAN